LSCAGIFSKEFQILSSMDRVNAFLSRNENKILAAVLAVSFLLSFAYSFYFRIQPIVDALAYDRISWELAEGKGYDRQSAIGRPGPAYEFFLAGIFYVFGHSYPAVWIIQALLHALTAFLVFRIAKLVFNQDSHPIIGLGAALLIGFSPDLITMSAMLMTETLTIFSMVFFVFLFFLYFRDKKISHLILSAAVLAIAALARSNLILLAFPAFLFLFWNKLWRPLLVFAAVLLLCLTPWTVRNYLVYAEFMPFNAAVGALLAQGNYHGASGELEPNFVWPEGYDQLSQIEFDKLARQDARRFIASHPLEFTKITFWRTSMYFSIMRPTGFWPHLKGFAKAATLASSFVYSTVLFLLGGLGAVLAIKGKFSKLRGESVFYLLLMSIMMPLAIIGIVVETRYRFPIYPFLALFSGLSLSFLLSKAKIAFKPGLIVALVLFGNAIFDAWRNLSRILERLGNL